MTPAVRPALRSAQGSAGFTSALDSASRSAATARQAARAETIRGETVRAEAARDAVRDRRDGVAEAVRDGQASVPKGPDAERRLERTPPARPARPDPAAASATGAARGAVQPPADTAGAEGLAAALLAEAGLPEDATETTGETEVAGKTEADGTAEDGPDGSAAPALPGPVLLAVPPAATGVRTAPHPAPADAAAAQAEGASAASVSGAASSGRGSDPAGAGKPVLSGPTADAFSSLKSDGEAAPAVDPAALPPAGGLAEAAKPLAGPAQTGPASHVVPTPAGQAAPTPVPVGQVPMTIGLRSLAGSSQFEIRLDPVDLGRIDVTLEIDRAQGTVTTHLVVERADTLALLQRDAGSLQQALGQAGLDATGEGSIQLSLRGEDRGRSEGGTRGEEGRPERPRPGAPALEASETGTAVMLRGYGNLDIRI